MARVRLEISGQAVAFETGMFAPKKAAEITEWFKEAAKASPRIPDPRKDKSWVLSNVVATVHTIIFELHNRETRERAYVYIDRTRSSLGG